MGRRDRPPVPRSRVPLHRLVVADPSVLRRWALVLALATLTAALTHRLLLDAEQTRRRWGDTADVLVTTRSVAAGDPLAGAVRVERWPVGLRPDRALDRLPGGATAASPLDPGLAVTRAAVDEDGGSGGPDDRRRVAVPVGTAPLPLERGDRVDVWATVAPSLAGGRLTTGRVATGAVVTSADDRTVVVAVTPREVPDVAEAAALATVTLVATG